MLVMFGTSYIEAQTAYENIEKIYRQTFPGIKIQIAFTSARVRCKIQERDGISIDSPLTALARLNDDGYVNVVVQSLHMIPGEEFHDMVNIVRSIEGIDGKFGFENLAIGLPLLISREDYHNVSSALAKQLDEFTIGKERTPHKCPRNADVTAVVFMGHGTEHPANSAYSQMANILATDYKNVFLVTIEGYPTYDEILKELKGTNIKNVRLVPFMVVAGEHALNDLTGNETDSWKSMLEKAEFKVDFDLRGLGENDDIAKIFVQHTKDALKKFH